MAKQHPFIKSVSSSGHSTSAVVAWCRDGDLYVAECGGKVARITPWGGPLGDAFSVEVNGRHLGTHGGGRAR